jgi:hypothetical protein
LPSLLAEETILSSFNWLEIPRTGHDITAGKNTTELPASLAKSLKKALKTKVDLDEAIEGDVSL